MVRELPAVFIQFRRTSPSSARQSRRFRGDFRRQCDGHANTATLIRKTAGNNFGRFAPLAWHSRKRGADLEFGAHRSGGSFLFRPE
jgi:hypothetical protein